MRHTAIKENSVHNVSHCCLIGQGQIPARQSAIASGLPISVSGTTVNMVCGSGLKAVALGKQAIESGDSVIVIAGGQESMSQVNFN